jgi:L-lactate dehydrogenase (cytochrome)
VNPAKAVNIEDLRRAAKARLPRFVFDYIDGGADDELTLKRNTDRLREHQLLWDALVDVSAIDTKTRVMGGEIALPFVLAPTALQRMFHKDGERAAAAAAGKAGTAYGLSTLGTTTVADVARATPGPKWYQIYVWKDHGLVREILQKAKAAGFTGAVLTVDLPVAGHRERDTRNGFAVPPKLSPKILAQVLTKPGWLYDFVTSPKLGPANYPGAEKTDPASLAQQVAAQYDQAVTWKDAAWMVEAWGGPFAIKGIAHPEDARRALDIGASCVWVSNHGGRQLETAPATIDLLPGIVDSVQGRGEIIFDSGVRRGTDIVKALALGANAVAIGRAYLYGLAAGGEAGVARAIQILADDVRRTMALIGAKDIASIARRLVLRPGEG